MKLEVTDRGIYDFINAIGEATKDDFINLYKERFAKRAGYQKAYFVIDIRDHPSVLDRDGFAQILNAAKSNGIEHVYMLVVTNDPARPLIGEMIEAVGVALGVAAHVTFYERQEQAETALSNLVNG